ncbi:DUF3566 domain-containing protein [Saccharothrix sp. 6-C]|uniref:Transmembrane protein DUF3566 n=1 Tax=Saccharothrix texasensis TaxID=103734 RepID=A0A3N1H9X1_9PSEU|nr:MULTISPECIES: DUF3566 domain-containing protein [Saccharothrix]QQQ76474.1 DUF3566 domain-containing protein [Saccharothrix sp. 6-C]ROP39313.1 transmembrane protein DUF3566 [Saccharothrix texasensis]
MTPPEKPEDKTAVITRPGAEPTPTAGDEPTGAEKPAVDASGASEQPETPAAEAAPADGKTEKVERPAADSDSHHAAPPPWQRVTSDTQYGEAQQVGPADLMSPPEPAEGSQPAYPASDPDTVAVARPVVPGVTPSGAARTQVNLGAANGRPAASAPSARRPGRGPRRASLQVKRVDPWSVLKLALVLSVALFFVWLVAVGVLYGVLNGMGVWDKINNTASDLLQGNETGSDPLISAGRVFGVAAIVGAVNIVLFTALATVGSFVYNVSADLAGGLEVTLSERE